MTDNGREFTLKGFKNRWGTAVKSVHDFEQVCQEREIGHRTTRPYTPKTSGMVERRNQRSLMNGLTKENTTKRNRCVMVQEMHDDLHEWFVRYTPMKDRTGQAPWYQKDCGGKPPPESGR